MRHESHGRFRKSDDSMFQNYPCYYMTWLCNSRKESDASAPYPCSGIMVMFLLGGRLRLSRGSSHAGLAWGIRAPISSLRGCIGRHSLLGLLVRWLGLLGLLGAVRVRHVASRWSLASRQHDGPRRWWAIVACMSHWEWLHRRVDDDGPLSVAHVGLVATQDEQEQVNGDLNRYKGNDGAGREDEARDYVGVVGVRAIIVRVVVVVVPN